MLRLTILNHRSHSPYDVPRSWERAARIRLATFARPLFGARHAHMGRAARNATKRRLSHANSAGGMPPKWPPTSGAAGDPAPA
jgi:hypothetical protein